MATARAQPSSRTSKRPKLNTGGDESNLNDLVNFQLPPRRQQFTGPRRSKKTAATAPWARERFVNSAYRFVLKPSVTADYTVHFVDPDIYFQWPDIIQILVPHTSSSLTGEGNTMCPICLGAPVAPRMTKCGHVYCYACILHYLQTSDQAGWHRCPICFDSISEAALKPVKWFFESESEALGTANGTAFKMRLMQRPQLTTLALPQSETWPSDLIPPHQAAFQFLPDIYKFAKFMLPTPKSLQDDLQEEIVSLSIDRDEKINVADGLGASFVERAITKVYRLIEDAKALDVPSLRDAINNAERGMEIAAEVAEKRQNVTRRPEFSPAQGDARPEHWADEHDNIQSIPREAAAATPSKQLKSRRNINPPPHSTSTYYFYQAASGSPVFLHPLDIRILLSHFGSYANFPRDIEVKVEARNEGTVDDDLRKRCKYLAHLPEAADVTFVEADLTSVVGKDTIAAFDSALKNRRARRREKERRDDRARVKAEERERDRLAEEHWVLKFSAARPTISSVEDEELQAFLGADTQQSSAQPAPPGAWGQRSFASTLSAPATATGQPRTSASAQGGSDSWDMDAAWKELELARATGAGGRKKKSAKLVLSLNGGGAPAGRRK